MENKIKVGDTVKFNAPFETYQHQPAKVVRVSGNMATLYFAKANRISVGYHVSKLTKIN